MCYRKYNKERKQSAIYTHLYIYIIYVYININIFILKLFTYNILTHLKFHGQ